MDRQKRVEMIVSDPHKYKICEGCESIVKRLTPQGGHLGVCPNCHSYRFDENTARVITHAKKLGQEEKQTVTPEDLK